LLQRGLGVEPDRDHLDVTGCDPTIVGELGEIEPRLDVDVVDFGIFGGAKSLATADRLSNIAAE
jgi:hypothetical protein